MQDMSKKVTVVHLITKGSPLGGAQQYVYTLATKLPKDTYTSIVICGQGDDLPQELEKESVLVKRLSYLQKNISIISELKTCIELISLLREIRPDILHTNSSKAGFLGAICGRCARVPQIVFTAHGWASNEQRSRLEKLFFLCIHWITIVLSHTTIAVSKKTREDVRSLPFVSKKIHVVYNGIAPFETYSKEISRDMFEKTYTIHNKNTLWIGTFSELHITKGIDILLQSLSSITLPWICIVCGEGSERTNLETLAQSLNIQDKVFFVGNIKNVKQYIRAFDIFTLTSRTEALPFSLLEAGSAGLPIIATRVGGIPEILDNGNNGILVRPHKTEIHNALIFLMKQAHKRQEFGEKIKEKIEKIFSQKNMIMQTMRIYQKIY
jgi:glycosyltransferase involved in cell wall biosynthesis